MRVIISPFINFILLISNIRVKKGKIIHFTLNLVTVFTKKKKPINLLIKEVDERGYKTSLVYIGFPWALSLRNLNNEGK